jgi:hypothetical protein
MLGINAAIPSRVVVSHSRSRPELHKHFDLDRACVLWEIAFDDRQLEARQNGFLRLALEQELE